MSYASYHTSEEEDNDGMDSEEEYKRFYEKVEREKKMEVVDEDTNTSSDMNSASLANPNNKVTVIFSQSVVSPRQPNEKENTNNNHNHINLIPPLRSARKASDSYPLIDNDFLIYEGANGQKKKSNPNNVLNKSILKLNNNNNNNNNAVTPLHRRTVSFHFHNIQKTTLHEMKKLLLDMTAHHYIMSLYADLNKKANTPEKDINLSQDNNNNNNNNNKEEDDCFRNTYLCDKCDDSSEEEEEEEISFSNSFLPPNNMNEKKNQENIFVLKLIPLLYFTNNNSDENFSQLQKETAKPKILDNIHFLVSQKPNKYITHISEFVSLEKVLKEEAEMKKIGKHNFFDDDENNNNVNTEFNVEEALLKKSWLEKNFTNMNIEEGKSNFVYSNSAFLLVREYINGKSMQEKVQTPLTNDDPKADPDTTSRSLRVSRRSLKLFINTNTNTNCGIFTSLHQCADWVWQCMHCLSYVTKAAEKCNKKKKTTNNINFHGNLKPGNVFFLSTNNNNEEAVQTKLSDAGLPSFTPQYFDLNYNNGSHPSDVNLNDENVILLRKNKKTMNHNNNSIFSSSHKKRNSEKSMKSGLIHFSKDNLDDYKMIPKNDTIFYKIQNENPTEDNNNNVYTNSNTNNRFFVPPECYILFENNENNENKTMWFTENKKSILGDIYALGLLLFYAVTQSFPPADCPTPALYTATPLTIANNHQNHKVYLALHHVKEEDEGGTPKKNTFLHFITKTLLKKNDNKHLTDIILKCLSLHPKKRFRALSEIKKHSFFRVFGSKRYELQEQYNKKQKEKLSLLASNNNNNTSKKSLFHSSASSSSARSHHTNNKSNVNNNNSVLTRPRTVGNFADLRETRQLHRSAHLPNQNNNNNNNNKPKVVQHFNISTLNLTTNNNNKNENDALPRESTRPLPRLSSPARHIPVTSSFSISDVNNNNNMKKGLQESLLSNTLDQPSIFTRPATKLFFNHSTVDYNFEKLNRKEFNNIFSVSNFDAVAERRDENNNVYIEEDSFRF